MIRTLLLSMNNLVTVLVGPPCCGKSTYLEQLDFNFVISSDDVVEALCKKAGIEYHDFFKASSKSDIKKQHHAIFNQRVRESKNYTHVVWDLTNLTIKARQSIFEHYSNATFNVIVFEVKDKADVIFKRNKERYQAHSKWIDEDVIQKMIASYQPIEMSEGFTDVQMITITDN